MNRDLSRLRREVSRSFDLSMAMLPRPMREPVSVAYLLARASDTLADAPGLPVERRLVELDRFSHCLESGGGMGDMQEVIGAIDHAGEKRLLAQLDPCLTLFRAMSPGPRELVTETLSVIISGQRLDLERMSESTMQALSAEELDDYCWRVAGCVGRFWTRIGFATLGPGFANAPAGELEALGIRYGKGLQLVNILRDTPRDVANGRCYLPVDDPHDPDALRAAAVHWGGVAAGWLGDGERYATALRSHRLRTASVLPALIGRETLALLSRSDTVAWTRGVKVGRRVVRRCLWRAALGR